MSAIRTLLALLCVYILAGCASLDWGRTPEEIVTRRAQERLDLLMKGDFKGSFEYVAPARRVAKDWKDHAYDYAGIRNWVSATVDQVVCEESRCKVTYIVHFRLSQPRVENMHPLKEVWIEVDGRWYLY